MMDKLKDTGESNGPINAGREAHFQQSTLGTLPTWFTIQVIYFSTLPLLLLVYLMPLSPVIPHEALREVL